MLKAHVSLNGQQDQEKVYELEYQKDGLSLNQEKFIWDNLQIKEGSFHILKNDKSYLVEVLYADTEAKTFTLQINQSQYTVKLQDRFDLLIHKLGMKSGANKVSEIKAPMPGLILEVGIEVGQSVQKGDTLLILEAMKMENIIKSPVNGEIKAIKINAGENVEKNQVLISFK